jgi:hypothetical protein
MTRRERRGFIKEEQFRVTAWAHDRALSSLPRQPTREPCFRSPLRDYFLVVIVQYSSVAKQGAFRINSL